MILLVPLSVSYPTYHVTTILPWYLQVWFPSLNPPTNENPTVIDLSLGGFLLHFSHLESKDLVSWIQQNHQAKWRLAWASRSTLRAFCQFFFARHAAISSSGRENDLYNLRVLVDLEEHQTMAGLCVIFNQNACIRVTKTDIVNPSYHTYEELAWIIISEKAVKPNI